MKNKTMKHPINTDLMKQARESLGLTQSEAARRIGVNRHLYLRWEGGWHAPHGKQIYMICKVLGISPNTLFWWKQ